MEPNAVLKMMKRYFEGRQPEEVLASFETTSPRSLLTESLDVVDFIVYLEEELGREIDIQKLGQALFHMNFEQLAGEVSRLLAADSL